MRREARSREGTERNLRAKLRKGSASRQLAVESAAFLRTPNSPRARGELPTVPEAVPLY
jgi:hypothetical protein